MERFFCPGRVELVGNHTDHQRGRIMAAAIDRGVTAEAEPNNDNKIRITSRSFSPIEVDLNRLWPDEAEQGSSAALVRGVAGMLSEQIPALRGFDASVTSDILPGKGLASSSAFTVLAAYMLAYFSGAELPPEELARVAQKAEARWYGKACGFMDFLACAMGGGVYMDVLENRVLPIDCDFDSLGLALCLTDTGGSTALAESAYADISADMTAVAQFFGEPFLARVRGPVFDEQWQTHQNDPQWMRARHFFDETWRAASMADALGLRDGQRYMELMNASGRSSETLLQNVWTEGCGDGLIRGLAASAELLEGVGAWRVHGGGFAGCVLALMPEEEYDGYQTAMDELFGPASCRRIRVSRRGVCRLTEEPEGSEPAPERFDAPGDGLDLPDGAAPLLDDT